MKRETPKWKKEKVKVLAESINKYPTIAICHLEGIPTKELQTIRNKLRDHATLIVSRKSIIRRALESSSNKTANNLVNHVDGISGILLSDLDPFELYSILKKNKSPAPAKAGQEAPRDIVIPAGPTPFAPGPIMSQLGAVGIKPKIEQGKLVVPEDTVIVRQGEKIKQAVAEILNRLDIKPMQVGLDVEAVLNKEDFYQKNLLDISEEEYIDKVKAAFAEAFNLSMNAEIINDLTIAHLLMKAQSDVKKLILSEYLIWEGETEKLLNIVNSQANALNNHIRGE
ncbi:MAG: 50S ribosomal protein L10 [Candidatus Woesearchaeota archaeon]|nr:MAG: 50S ribosomal protein L10 [Candidatus Woesearchaeota archaeon]